MRLRLLISTLLLCLSSCTSATKSITFTTSPAGASIIVNGEELPQTSPVTAEVEQQQNLTVTAVKEGYELASTVVPTEISYWRAWLWTRYDKDARYIEADEVYLKLQPVATIESVVQEGRSMGLPAYDPSVKLPLIPILPTVVEGE